MRPFNPSLLAKYVDSVLYVIRCDYTKMPKIRGGIESLTMRNVNIMGYVFNGDINQKTGRYGYGYDYSYGYGHGYGKYSQYGRYGGGYLRYGRKMKDTGKTEDESGRIIKE